MPLDSNDYSFYLDSWKKSKVKTESTSPQLKNSISKSLPAQKDPKIRQNIVTVSANDFIKSFNGIKEKNNPNFIAERDGKDCEFSDFDLIEKGNEEFSFTDTVIFEEDSASKNQLQPLQVIKQPDCLPELLEKIWEIKEIINDIVYLHKILTESFYNNVLTNSPILFFEDLSTISNNKNNNFFSNFYFSLNSLFIDIFKQISLKEPDFFYKLIGNNQIPAYFESILKDYFKLESLDGSSIKTAFYFQSEKFNPEAINKRLFLSVKADNIPEFCYFLVNEVLENHIQFPGIEMLKVFSPGSLTPPIENCVLYVSDNFNLDKIISCLKKYQEKNPEHFIDIIPKMSKFLLKGISIADEPIRELSIINYGYESFSSLRLKIIFRALNETKNKNLSKEKFFESVFYYLNDVGISPENFHENIYIKAGKTTPTAIKANIEKDVIIKILKKEITEKTEPAFFEDDLFYFVVKIVEKNDHEWLVKQLKSPIFDKIIRLNIAMNLSFENKKNILEYLFK